jgi:hypothetical protein
MWMHRNVGLSGEIAKTAPYGERLVDGRTVVGNRRLRLRMTKSLKRVRPNRTTKQTTLSSTPRQCCLALRSAKVFLALLKEICCLWSFGTRFFAPSLRLELSLRPRNQYGDQSCNARSSKRPSIHHDNSSLGRSDADLRAESFDCSLGAQASYHDHDDECPSKTAIS